MKEIITTECVVIGGGIIGLAIASKLSKEGRNVILLEKEERLVEHTSSRNSEVIHSGIYYNPESLKARLCNEGKHLLYEYCQKSGVNHNQIGKMIIGDENSEGYLQRLFENGVKNQVRGLKLITEEKIKLLEPEVNAKYAILSETTGIIDSHELAISLENDIETNGGHISIKINVSDFEKTNNGWELTIEDENPFLIKTEILINAAGLESYNLAKKLGVKRLPKARFFIGHYYKYNGNNPFKRLIYPVPDESGLGIHSTSDLEGRLRFGPDAQEITDISYKFRDPDKRREIFMNSIKKYFINLKIENLQPDYTGIRIRLGETHFESDFLIRKESDKHLDGLINLIGIESPGLTSSLAIAKHVSNLI